MASHCIFVGWAGFQSTSAALNFWIPRGATLLIEEREVHLKGILFRFPLLSDGGRVTI